MLKLYSFVGVELTVILYFKSVLSCFVALSNLSESMGVEETRWGNLVISSTIVTGVSVFRSFNHTS